MLKLSHEDWRIVPINNENSIYEINGIGDVRNSRTCLMLQPSLNKRGYAYVVLWHKKKQYSKLVHRLVGMVFISNPENKSEINHKDGNKSNNSYTNLEWSTRLENQRHAEKMRLIKHAVGTSVATNIFSEKQVHEVCQLLQLGIRPCKIIERTGVNRDLVDGIRFKGSWAHISKNYQIDSKRLDNKWPDGLSDKITTLTNLGYGTKQIALALGMEYNESTRGCIKYFRRLNNDSTVRPSTTIPRVPCQGDVEQQE